MKKKVFKYKFIYWLIITLNITILISFGFGSFNRIRENSFSDKEEILFSITAFSIFILSIISLILLILKHKNSLTILSCLLVLIMITFSIGILMSIFIIKDFGEYKGDYFVASCLYLIVFGFLFIIQRFKYKKNEYENIEEIGQHKE